MRFLIRTLIANGPDPVTGRTPTANARLHLFGVTIEDQWERNREGYELFRRLWREERTSWQGRFRPGLTDAETWPPPRQRPIRIWHGSATSTSSVELAARYGDPLFSANVTPIEPYAELVTHYRERWAAHGHDPADALVGAGTAGFHVAPTSQRAIEEYRPIFIARSAQFARAGVPVMFPTLEDFVERSPALVGGPQQVIDKALRYQQVLGYEVIHLHADSDGRTPNRHRAAGSAATSGTTPRACSCCAGSGTPRSPSIRTPRRRQWAGHPVAGPRLLRCHSSGGTPWLRRKLRMK